MGIIQPRTSACAFIGSKSYNWNGINLSALRASLLGKERKLAMLEVRCAYFKALSKLMSFVQPAYVGVPASILRYIDYLIKEYSP
ncbi:hypothetical protein HMPREF0765_4303 [Sphingobacterium spiritivorum ATCC 33300]|uniref:Uncharacterized protein n=1 Tax=Sphingobacterium spiritivorum ATCC 33300 TaxID=525372 RepID=C2G3Z7_SPHSI|nr:hypothetical protein HMPREF0765_4303 [Sphingobacterium spiritivorum ATCC 33300]